MTDTSVIDPITTADDAATSEQDVASTAPTSAAVAASPLDAEKSAFAKLVAFVEQGIENLGHEAEAELVELAKKYL